jgi:hypothetical protein
MTKIKDLKNPKKWFQDWIGGSIKKKIKKLKSGPKVPFEIKN